ncbi:hypothetical protein F5B22DRAFT_449789 [Xylaria bambusicola]|uniref:uncharacterized protein n=1 Tax=Xylaria bambusicola TaxID=326684 RepID=UPI0020086C51|nr:uncharacterized protein F5B22DRAFT_449789 [Xylaria bambusicola]KAI0506476.1 hypothetical protein F5B22DRAFT_449789 [Xylaria bambusicola]
MLGRALVLGCLIGFASVAFAADLAGFNPNDVPECGLLCISGTVSQKSSCSPTDFACVCANDALIGEIEACIAHSCPPRDALTTAKIAKALCGVESRNINLAVWLVPLVTIILSTIFFILKLVSRFVLQQQVDVSDIMLGISVALTLPVLWVAFRLSQLGLGHDVWSIPQDNITKILYLYWWAEIIYQSGLPLTRIAILFFYLKVFPQKHIRWASYALIGLNAANLIAFVLATIFQCSPIYGAWTFWDGTFQGHCNDLHLQSWIQAGINIALDLTTIILPLPSLAKLSASRGRKIRIIIMFALGFFITIISVLRLRTLVVFANSTNVSYDYVEPGLYSIIEASVSIICGCLPSVRALLLTITPKLLTLTNRSKFSNSQTPPGESSRQKFDRLDDCESAKSPIKVKNEWSIHSQSTHQGLESGSNVELVTMDTTRSRSSIDSEHEEATRTVQSVNWSRPLPRSHEGGLA